jgi:hypothetical protein
VLAKALTGIEGKQGDAADVLIDQQPAYHGKGGVFDMFFKIEWNSLWGC